ncbi:hypothetical protein EDL99_05755 [Ornithobacterium rhinotracheale]|uniref:hypothetical protein n=1 Tax=Ornithobacterium rhinotracheale TaxID=28251 RepID=UPI00129C8E3C|nr:hypothetical protein [Ornithobacterium rhinotracheale]MRJ08378.1 hypothetical protein [Ornithobacterium rhinotracheale]UOH77571.1 hypothetical protein MT996_10235 [Ornithobacterium rhinotracheale]
MKRILVVIATAFLATLNAQVHVERAESRPSGESALIDFPDGTKKGLILPTVKEQVTQTGALAFGEVDGKLEVYYVNSNGTQILSRDTFIEGVPNETLGGKKNEKLDISVYDNPEQEQGVIIGDLQSEAKGVLIFESKDKAPVLPHVESPAKNIPSPEPGTICYDTATGQVAVFDGANWYFWTRQGLEK